MAEYHACAREPPTCKGLKKGIKGYHECAREKKCRKKDRPPPNKNPWLAHVATVKRSNASMAYKDVLKLAKTTYKTTETVKAPKAKTAKTPKAKTAKTPKAKTAKTPKAKTAKTPETKPEKAPKTAEQWKRDRETRDRGITRGVSRDNQFNKYDDGLVLRIAIRGMKKIQQKMKGKKALSASDEEDRKKIEKDLLEIMNSPKLNMNAFLGDLPVDILIGFGRFTSPWRKAFPKIEDKLIALIHKHAPVLDDNVKKFREIQGLHNDKVDLLTDAENRGVNKAEIADRVKLIDRQIKLLTSYLNSIKESSINRKLPVSTDDLFKQLDRDMESAKAFEKIYEKENKRLRRNELNRQKRRSAR